MLQQGMKIIGLIFLMAIFLYAQTGESPLVLQKLEGKITLDGKVNEAAWKKIDPLPLVTHWPEFGNAPSDVTELRVTYDDNYIYFSGICMADKENILAASFKRDLFTLGTDYISIVLDTFNDNENALVFSTTPTGNRSDQAISEDAGRRSSSWDTFWKSEAVVEENRWSAEMRIPFSSLGFQVIDGKVTMGIMAWRYTAKKNEMDIYPKVRPDWGFWSFVKPSQMQKVIFKGIESSNPVYITPYLLGGQGQQNVLNSSETDYKKETDISRNIGLDVKYNITDNLTLDFSINTDFAQVEADDQQVNLTRFSLFFPEKRRFFLERASIFDFSFGGFNRLFYTRRLGLQGDDPITILAGSRPAGRIGDWDIGILNVQTEGQSGLPPENFSVVRLRKQVINPYSYFGGILTNKIDRNGDYHIGYGLDGVFRLFGDDYLTFNLARTGTNTTTDKYGFAKNSRVRFLWERRTYTDLGYQVSLEGAGKDYNPVMGFEFRKNFTRLKSNIGYGWQYNGHPLFQRTRVLLAADVFRRNADGIVETIEIAPSWQAALVSGASFSLRVTAIREDLIAGFKLADNVEIADGQYTYYDANTSFSTPGGNELSSDFNLSYGSFFDGTKFSVSISPKWIVSRYFELNGSYNYDILDFVDRGGFLESHLFRLRTLLALNTKLSLAAFIQYSSTANISLANLRFRFNPEEGHDLYIVYNEQYNNDRRRKLPVLPVSRNRAVLAKYTYTFTF
jgi:Domain of unknown function (DUF5916)/Carbohydrate family 9 binding domain-like